MITIALATIGSTASLYSHGNHLAVAYVAMIFAAAVCASAYRAVQCLRPDIFNLPGNLPENWLPHCWEDQKRRTMRQGRVEQARYINFMIHQNTKWSEKAGRRLQQSIDWMIAAVSALIPTILLIMVLEHMNWLPAFLH